MSEVDAILDRSLKKIKQQIEAKEYYEASQLYLSVANRQFKKTPEKGIQLFFDGCVVLAKEKQYEYVLALSKKLAQDVSGEKNIPVTCKGIFGVIYNLLPVNSPLREEYQKQCISCLSISGKHKDLCEDLYYIFGVEKYINRDYKSAEKDFVMSGKKGGLVIGNICKNILSIGTPNAENAAAIVLLHAVISYLSHGTPVGANNVLAAFEGDSNNLQKYWDVEASKFKKAKKYKNGIINLAQIVFLAILTRNEMLFKYIIQNYTEAIIKIDSKLSDMTSSIMSLYFQTTAPPLMSLLENIGGFI